MFSFCNFHIPSKLLLSGDMPKIKSAQTLLEFALDNVSRDICDLILRGDLDLKSKNSAEDSRGQDRKKFECFYRGIPYSLKQMIVRDVLQK